MTFKSKFLAFFSPSPYLRWEGSRGLDWLIAIPPNQIRLAVSLPGQAVVMATSGCFSESLLISFPCLKPWWGSWRWNPGECGAPLRLGPQKSWNQMFFKFGDCPVIFLLLISDFHCGPRTCFVWFQVFRQGLFYGPGYGLFWWLFLRKDVLGKIFCKIPMKSVGWWCFSVLYLSFERGMLNSPLVIRICPFLLSVLSVFAAGILKLCC